MHSACCSCVVNCCQREDFSPTGWLTDDTIEAAQRLIQENNPLVGGLQPPYLGQKCSFTIETGKYIQVVHNEADHWLVVTNIGVHRDGVVRVYDSLYKCLTTSTLELQIASIVNTSQPKISMEFVDVQKQFESSDCGVTICNSLLTGSGSGIL